MDVIKYNINNTSSICVTCSECGRTRQGITINKPRIGRGYKIRCKCNNEFLIMFERRKHIRKKVKLIGIYTIHNNLRSNIIDIVDVSRGGCAFIKRDRNDLKIGDTISIRFNLDNSQNDIIESMALIKNVFNNKVCVEFLVMKASMERSLGFYFL